MKSRFFNFAFSLAVFVIVFAGHSGSSHITSTDSQWSVHTAISMVREGNIDLDEFGARRHDGRFPSYGAIRYNGVLYPYYPLGPSIIAAPVIALFLLAPKRYVPECEAYMLSSPLRMEMYTAAIIVAFVSVLLYKSISLAAGKKLLSFFLAMVFAFSTPAWSTASRALWQHGPSMLMLVIALYIFLLSRKQSSLSAFAALPLGFSFWIRPTNLIPIAVFGFFAFMCYRKYFIRYILLTAAVLAPLFAMNLIIYGHLLAPYYGRSFGGGVCAEYGQALLMNLISPNRGLLVFSPVFLFSFWGMYLSLKTKQPDKLHICLMSIIILHWLGISVFAPVNWWAGHSFGPRLFSDVVPFLVFFLIFPVEKMPGMKNRALKYTLVFLFSASVVFGAFVHYRGAYVGETWLWNVHPVDVDRDPSRLWDWRDLQFMRTPDG